MYRVFDEEQSGVIELRRFMLVIMALSGGSPEENIEKIFYMVDINNDGYISSEVENLILQIKFYFLYLGIQGCIH